MSRFGFRNRLHSGIDPAKGKPAFVSAVVPETVIGLNPIRRDLGPRVPKVRK